MAMVMLGVDVSKPRLDAVLWQPMLRKIHARQTENSGPQAAALVEWACSKAKVSPARIRVVMEATGPYHEEAAEAFHAAGCQVVIANPQRVRCYASGRGQLNKTDGVDAQILARYGEQNEDLALWQPPAPQIRLLKALLARIQAVEQDLQREENRLEKAQAAPTPAIVLESLQRGISTLQNELQRLRSDLDDHIDCHPGLRQDEKLLMSIPGIGQTTARRLMCLLRARRFDSARQAAAFIGLSVLHHQSGKTRLPPRLAKNGDAAMRASMYFPAVTATRHNELIAGFYKRLLATGKTKMSALGAVMRKLVHLAFGVLKHQTPFNPNFAIETR